MVRTETSNLFARSSARTRSRDCRTIRIAARRSPLVMGLVFGYDVDLSSRPGPLFRPDKENPGEHREDGSGDEQADQHLARGEGGQGRAEPGSPRQETAPERLHPVRLGDGEA